MKLSYSVLHYRVEKILALQSRMVSLLFPFLASDPFHSSDLTIIVLFVWSILFSSPRILICLMLTFYLSFTHLLLNETLDVLRESNLTWLACSPFTTHSVQVLESL